MLRWLTDTSLADSIAGDLEEQRRQRARTSPMAAALWYWRAYLAVVIYLLARRPVEGRPRVMRTISSDIRDAARLFRRAPFFGAAAVLILALGTGATSAILSLADKALIRPLPIPDVDRVVQSTFSFSYLDFRDLAKEHGGFSQVAAWGYPPLAIEQGGDALQVTGALVSGDYFALIGQQPVAGRLLNRSDDVTGEPATGVMSERLWTRVFRRDPQIVGSVLIVNRAPVAIVGISPAAFRGPSLQIAPELFINLPSLANLTTGFMANPATLTDRGRVFLTIAARLNDGVSLDQANEEARRIYYSRRASASPDTSAWFAPMLSQALGAKTSGDLRQFMTILLGASAITMLLTCATVANLLLVRSERRRHELAVRAALGAGRGRLCRLLLVESLGIGLAGGLAGVGVAALALKLLGTFMLPGQISIHDLQLTINTGMLASCVAIGLLTAVVFGLAPIWQLRRVDAGTTLRAGGRTTPRHAARSVLVGLQIAICVVLLGGSFAFGRAIVHALALDLGFNVTHTSITGIDPSLTRLSDERSSALRRETLDNLRARPGVRAAAWALRRPMSGGFVLNPIVEGRDAAANAPPLNIQANVVTDGYFDVMQIPLVSGRVFTALDEHSPVRVAIVSTSLARTLWPDGQILGRRLSMENPGSADMKWIAVVGEVADIHRVIGGPPVPMLYLASGQTPQGFDPGFLMVRSTGDPSSVLPDVRTVLRGIEPHVVITSSMPMSDHVEAPLMAHRLGLMLFAMFASLAVALTGFGLYAVVATAVAQRSREIGIRLALGAESTNILSMVVRHGVWPIGCGLAAGIAAFAFSARLIAGFMFSIPAVSPAALAAIGLAIGVLTFVAMIVPARRALSVNPTVVLKVD
ncbi:MAG TPA: ADOP family duplicated permease [Vicinamibacterales bacterium]|nr:ADOP family duplicated permease [Vicinamibacterales bacterium]